jgi:pimeloyl-ACP methyl ester carboxylesterase
VAAVHHRYATVRGRRLFYRAAGPAGGPVVVLPHGFPASSFMFRDLIPRLGRDDPGFGPGGALAFAAGADHVRHFPGRTPS